MCLFLLACLPVFLLCYCRAKLAASEKALAGSEDSLSKEKSQVALLRQRCSGVTSELDVMRAKWQNAVDSHTTATAQIVELNGKVAALTEQVCGWWLSSVLVQASICFCFVSLLTCCLHFVEHSCVPNRCCRHQAAASDKQSSDLAAKLSSAEAAHRAAVADAAAKAESQAVKHARLEASLAAEKAQKADITAALSASGEQVSET